MLVTTTMGLEGHRIQHYHGLVTGEVILGMNLFRDLFARVRDIVGGRTAGYEEGLRRGREYAVEAMTERAAALGANAIIAVDLDYNIHGQGMLLVVASGTAVTIDPPWQPPPAPPRPSS